MKDFREAKLEFVKIQNARLEEQRRLDQEGYEKQNERVEKCLNF